MSRDNSLAGILNYSNITVIVVVLFINYIIFFKYELDSQSKIKNIIQMYSSLSIFLTVYSLYSQYVNREQDRINSEINYVNGIFETIHDKIMSFFVANQSMKYYYNELYHGESKYIESDRNILLENLITYRILYSIDALINYIDSYKRINIDNFQLDIATNKIKKLLQMFLKSKIFVEHWKNFSKDIALKWTKNYVDFNFSYQ